jgi:multiple sugar transport system ATP-binding protein
MTLGDRVAILRAGAIQQVATPRELYESPANLFVAEFVGTPPMNVLPARLAADRLVLPMLEVPLDPAQRQRIAAADGALVTGIRPEDLLLPEAGGKVGAEFEATVDLVEWLGAELFVHLDAGPASLAPPPAMDGRTSGAPDRLRLIARLNPATAVAEGERLRLGVDLRALHVFDPVTGERVGHFSQRQAASMP